MSQYLEYPVARAVVLGKNRRGVLIGFGVTAIALGLIAMLYMGYAWFSILRMMRMAPAGANFSFPARFMLQFGLATAMTMILSTLFAWGGVAMIRCRRWVAPLGLAVAVAWLVVGLSAAGSGVVELVRQEGPMPSDVMGVMMYWGGVALMFVFGVALPVAYVLIFTGTGVRQTLEAYDPYPVWTDRHRPAVLAVAVWCVLGALILLGGSAGEYERLFGTFVRGGAAVVVSIGWVVLLVLTAVCCLAGGTRVGWWLALAVLTLYVASMILTDWLGDVRVTFGDEIGADYVEQLLKQYAVTRWTQTVEGALAWVAGAMFLVRTRGSFDGSAGPANADEGARDAASGDRVSSGA